MKGAVKAFITLVPVFSLTVVTACTVWYNYYDDSYLIVYSLLSNLFGFSLFWLPVYFYVASRYNLCFYTKAALIGLTLYTLINITYDVSRMLGFPLDSSDYMILIETTGLACAIVTVFIFIVRRFFTDAKRE